MEVTILTWSLILFPSSRIFFILKSIPIVVMKVGENESLAYLNNKHVFPTPNEEHKIDSMESKKTVS